MYPTRKAQRFGILSCSSDELSFFAFPTPDINAKNPTIVSVSVDIVKLSAYNIVRCNKRYHESDDSRIAIAKSVILRLSSVLSCFVSVRTIAQKNRVRGHHVKASGLYFVSSFFSVFALQPFVFHCSATRVRVVLLVFA